MTSFVFIHVDACVYASHHHDSMSSLISVMLDVVIHPLRICTKDWIYDGKANLYSVVHCRLLFASYHVRNCRRCRRVL